MLTRRLRPVLLIGVPLAACIGALAFWLQGGRFITTNNAYVKADIIKVAAEISGKVQSVAVRDHQPVERGAVLLSIDPEPFRLALRQAEAELDAARQDVETLKGSLDEANSELAEAKARADYFEQRALRQRKLKGRGIVSDSKLDDVENDANAARDRIRVLQEKRKRVLAALGGNADLKPDDHPRVRIKLAARDRAQLELTHTIVRAPDAGIAVNVKLQPGEQVTASVPVFAIIASTRPWIEANFKETELTHVSVGQTASLVLDIYPDIVFQAEVESISPATGAEFAILPPQNASGNWVKVVQRLPVRLHLKPHAGAPELRAGMTAAVTIDTRKQRHIADLFGASRAQAH